MDNLNQAARDIIINTIYCTIATATEDGSPWITPVFFNYDPKSFTIYWVSAKTTTHSQLIAKNPRVAISVYDSHAPFGQAQGVYITGRATEVATHELKKAIDIYYGGRFPNKEIRAKVSENNFLADAQHRLYAATPEKAWIMQNPKAPSASLVDVRTPVTLAT